MPHRHSSIVGVKDSGADSEGGAWGKEKHEGHAHLHSSIR